jgi:glycosyltransferase involved in cell wall biosynthesis
MIRHIITSEYPPQPGGVSDYTRIVAEGLAAAGDEVHVWCPRANDAAPNCEGVFVHREMGAFTPQDLRVVSRLLEEFPAPRHVLVQWVPHGYGFQSMNIAFCLWLWRRALCGDEVELMVHEPSLGFGEGSWKHNIVAAVHRLMTIVLLRATRRVWVSIPAWERRWRPYTLGRKVEFRWLPVGSNIPVVEAPLEAQQLCAHFVNDGCLLVGHFGSYDTHTADLLLKSVPELAKEDVTLLLLGHGGERMRAALIEHAPAIADRVHATGTLDAAELSRHIRACDLMLQPYSDGVTSRRTSTITALAHGVPVVTTRGKFTESLWAESKAIALAPVEEVLQLVEETRRLMPDAAARNGIRTAARKFYVEHFDSSRIIARLREDAV